MDVSALEQSEHQYDNTGGLEEPVEELSRGRGGFRSGQMYTEAAGIICGNTAV